MSRRTLRRVAGGAVATVVVLLVLVMASFAIPRDLFRKIMRRIDQLRPPAVAAG